MHLPQISKLPVIEFYVFEKKKTTKRRRKRRKKIPNGTTENAAALIFEAKLHVVVLVVVHPLCFLHFVVSPGFVVGVVFVCPFLFSWFSWFFALPPPLSFYVLLPMFVAFLFSRWSMFFFSWRQKQQHLWMPMPQFFHFFFSGCCFDCHYEHFFWCAHPGISDYHSDYHNYCCYHCCHCCNCRWLQLARSSDTFFLFVLFWCARLAFLFLWYLPQIQVLVIHRSEI